MVAKIKVATYNLRGVGANAETIDKIASLLLESQVQIVAFQEVVIRGVDSKMYDLLVASMKKRDYVFRRFETPFSTRQYIEVIFVKVGCGFEIVEGGATYTPFRRTSQHNVNHGISTYLMAGRIMKQGVPVSIEFYVSTTQIEAASDAGPVIQREQLAQLSSLNTKQRPSMLLVDTNLRSYQQLSSSSSEVPNYIDAWRVAGDLAADYTYDTKRNHVAALFEEQATDRRDRIYLKSSLELEIQAENLGLLGVTDKVLSSHYGVVATILITVR